MAGTLQFDLVSPERRLASVQATEVQIPGADGDLTAMEGHAPTITTLRPGILKAVSADGAQRLCGDRRLCRDHGDRRFGSGRTRRFRSKNLTGVRCWIS